MTSEVRHKRGDVREDGMVFWAKAKHLRGGEYWVDPQKFKAKQAANQQWSRKNPQYLVAWKKNNAAEYSRSLASWASANPNYGRLRYASEPLFALSKRLRSRANSAFRQKGLRKSTKTEAMLDCTYEEFKAHIEAQFLPGMSWDNRHLWHIDHIVPCEAADTSEDMERLFHFTNLRPLWGKENQSKNAKLPEEHELPADLHDEVRKIWQRAKDSACTK